MIGKTISHYRIIEKLGEGGMGVVYKAEDSALERTVALKFLSPQTLGTEEEKVRFVREAKAAAALDHPNICTIYEIGEAEGQTFIAMAYVDGRSLAEVIESGPLDVDKAVNIVLRVAEGLRHAHKRGIVHRDIKPANIMVAEGGEARIMDFGLAKLSGRTRLTRTATIMGTVAYMSPEQARGDSTVDHRTDVWSLGVLLYEMLTGVLPFEAETDTGLIYKIVHDDPEPIRNHRGDIPGSLASIVEKALQKEAQNRYEKIDALIEDLEAVKSGIGSSMTTPSPSIVVLPFVNMSADPEQEYFCDGMAEELINALTQLQDLWVVARTSAFSFKGEKLDVRDIGRRLNVETVLEGSVRKAGSRLRITAQLVDVTHGYHLWSERFDREMHDVFAIQDEITLAIVDKLKVKLLGKDKAHLGKRRTVDLEAYNLYLKARYFWGKRTDEGAKKAFEYYEQAIEQFPNYALAHAGLAELYFTLPIYMALPPREMFSKAREAAQKALELDDTLAEAHASLAMIKALYDWDWQSAELGLKRAIELNPGYAVGHGLYALLLMAMARFDEAVDKQQRVLQLDPLHLMFNRNLGMIFLFARQYDEAIGVLQRTVEMDPAFTYTHSFLGLAYMGKSMYEEALAEFREEERLRKGRVGVPATGEAVIGCLHALAGDTDQAKHVLSDLAERSRQEYMPPFYLACLCFSLGENDQGFEWLEKSYEMRDPFMTQLKIHQLLDPVRSDPRYIAMLKRMGLDT